MTKAQIKNYLVDTAVDEMTKYLIEDYILNGQRIYITFGN